MNTTTNTTKTQKALGKTQMSILRSLVNYQGWSGGCGWYWTNYSTTVRLLDSLVKRGLATKHVAFGRDAYKATEAGVAIADAKRNAAKAKLEAYASITVKTTQHAREMLADAIVAGWTVQQNDDFAVIALEDEMKLVVAYSGSVYLTKRGDLITASTITQQQARKILGLSEVK